MHGMRMRRDSSSGHAASDPRFGIAHGTCEPSADRDGVHPTRRAARTAVSCTPRTRHRSGQRSPAIRGVCLRGGTRAPADAPAWRSVVWRRSHSTPQRHASPPSGRQSGRRRPSRLYTDCQVLVFQCVPGCSLARFFVGLFVCLLARSKCCVKRGLSSYSVLLK